MKYIKSWEGCRLKEHEGVSNTRKAMHNCKYKVLLSYREITVKADRPVTAQLQLHVITRRFYQSRFACFTVQNNPHFYVMLCGLKWEKWPWWEWYLAGWWKLPATAGQRRLLSALTDEDDGNHKLWVCFSCFIIAYNRPEAFPQYCTIKMYPYSSAVLIPPAGWQSDI